MIPLRLAAPDGADVRGGRRGEGAAQRDDHADRVGRHPRRFARDDAAAAPADEADRGSSRLMERADLGGDRRQVRARRPDVAPAAPPMRLITEKLEIGSDRRRRAVRRAEARKDDRRLPPIPKPASECAKVSALWASCWAAFDSCLQLRCSGSDCRAVDNGPSKSPQRNQRPSTFSSVTTTKRTRLATPKAVDMATSAASRPRPITMRPMRGWL